MPIDILIGSRDTLVVRHHFAAPGSIDMNLTLALPDPVALEAQAAGLLTSEAIEAMLKRELRRKAGARFSQSAAALALNCADALAHIERHVSTPANR